MFSRSLARYLLRTKPNSRGFRRFLAARHEKRPSIGGTRETKGVGQRTRTLVSPLSYKKLSSVEHVLLRPDTYIGSTMPTEYTAWVYDADRRAMIRRPVVVAPGLLKIFDEILVNAADNKQRDPTMTEIRVDVDRATGSISVFNDGRGLPIDIHPEEGVYVPTLIFGSLFTSSNYDDQEIKVVGGRNGFGAKLCNIYSTRFSIETASTESGKVFEQTWTSNMSIVSEPAIRDFDAGETRRDFTRVTFTPDWSRFHMQSIDDDIIALIDCRVRDVAGTMKGVRVFLNGEETQPSGFRDYVNLYVHGRDVLTARGEEKGEEEGVGGVSDTVLYRYPDERWEYALAVASPGQGFEQVSFVNNIATRKGGRHVDVVLDGIVQILKKWLDEKLHSKAVTTAAIRRHLFLFVNCLIENPTFDSQLKETLITRPKDFGSQATIHESSLIEWAEQAHFDDVVAADLNLRSKRDAKRSGAMKRPLIAKLEDAEWAGSAKSNECSLILTEGDSAKALAISGLQVVGRQKYGVFPLRGKITNVSGMTEEQVLRVQEVSALVDILGLKFGANYADDQQFGRLRYGKVIILADQDEDGSHIKGLLINVFYRFWPSLLKERRFLSSFATPLIKARRGTETHVFYTKREFDEWMTGCTDHSTYSIKYYKGLGTSTAEEAREYFTAMEKSMVHFEHGGEEDDEAIQMAFDRDAADQRKTWIAAPSKDDDPIGLVHQVSYKEFIDQELKQFAKQDLRRSIPSVVDGLKRSQRKVLYTCFKMGDRREQMKVSRLAAHVAQTCNYHHGEDSLVDTIIRMAQSFVGSNNLPLLRSIGQFGTRLMGGEDAASARYIYTALSPISRLLFPAVDDPVYEYLNEENEKIEPKWFCPVIPLVLVNGAHGIATGWASTVLHYHPMHIVDRVRHMIEEKESDGELAPFYNDFRGSLTMDGTRMMSAGSISRENGRKSRMCTLNIGELPIGVWTQNYKERVLMSMAKEEIIRDIRELHTDRHVHFSIDVPRHLVEKKTKEKLLKMFKLTSTTSTNSMVLFDPSNELRHYRSTSEIMGAHFETRKEVYKKRLRMLVAKAETRLARTRNELLFVSSYAAGRIGVSSKAQMEADCERIGCAPDTESKRGRFAYLIDLPVSRLTKEEETRLGEVCREREKEVEDARGADYADAWNEDLDRLERQIQKEYSRNEKRS